MMSIKKIYIEQKYYLLLDEECHVDTILSIVFMQLTLLTSICLFYLLLKRKH